MTADEALARLQSMLAWDSDPELSTDEVTSLLSMCKLSDAYGLAPSDASWTPTYNLNRGAAEGWRWKAAKCANRPKVSADGTSIDDTSVYDNCIKQVTQYQRKAGVASIRVPGYGSIVTGVSAAEPNAT